MKETKKTSNILKTFLLSATIVLIPLPAYAMHISEGILPVRWAILWSIVAFLFVAAGIAVVKRKSKEDPFYTSFLGLMGAAIFILSLLPIPIPIVGTSSHPAGTGIAAIFIGPFAAVVITLIALLIQALFLAHGGITTLGANVLSMGVAGAFLSYTVFVWLKALKVPLLYRAFAAGFVGDIATYAATSIFLGLGITGGNSPVSIILKIFIAFMPTQIPLAILEGVLASYMIIYVQNHRPEILHRLNITVPTKIETVKTAGVTSEN